MNLKQLAILAVVVVALVFVVTFASQYLGGGGGRKGPDPNPNPGGAHLVFPDEKVFPRAGVAGEPEFIFVQEANKTGHHDFPFESVSAAPLQLGLSAMGCTCSKVEVCVLPEERWKGLSEDLRRAPPEQDTTLTWEPLKEYKDDRKGVAVPPGAGGWVRLQWDGRKLGPQQLTASLWTEAALPTAMEPAEHRLTATVTFWDPITCQDEEFTPGQSKSDEKRLGKLEPGVDGRARFLCWSATRNNFTVKPLPTGNECVQVADPVRLNDEERKQLADLFKVPVLCAYRVPVTVREQVNDTQLDLGLFRYRVTLETDAGPRAVYVSGEIEGPITVVTPDGRSHYDVGKFPAREGTEVIVNLTSNDPSLKLKLDPGPSKRRPFFQAREPEEIKEAVGKRWRIEVKIPGDSIEGRFPNPSKPGSEPDDCSLYLGVYRTDEPAGKTEQPWRRIRIPLVGEATSR